MTAIGEPVSVMRKSSLALTYHVEGALGAPSDNLPHEVSIAVLLFEVTIQHMTVPKVQLAPYLQARVKNTSDYRPIPGTVHVFVDDSFVSKTGMIEDAAPSGEFNYTLGTDSATRIHYGCIKKSADDAAAQTQCVLGEVDRYDVSQLDDGDEPASGCAARARGAR
jgi:hypothetical protein